MGLLSIIRAIHVIYRYTIVYHNLIPFILIHEVLIYSPQKAKPEVHPEATHSHERLSFFSSPTFLYKYLCFFLFTLSKRIYNIKSENQTLSLCNLISYMCWYGIFMCIISHEHRIILSRKCIKLSSYIIYVYF